MTETQAPPAPAVRHGLMSRMAGGNVNLAGAIYGTVIGMALVAALPEKGLSASEEFWTYFATGVVFWVTHAYAVTVASWVGQGRRPNWGDGRRALLHEWPIMQAFVPGSVFLLLGSFNVFGQDAAEELTLIFGTALLGIWGVVIGQAARLRPWGVVGVSVLNVLLGLGVVAVKAALH